MAWNEPNGGDKSPWGKRPANQSAGLDEAVKAWQRKFESFWRKGGSPPGGASSSGSGDDSQIRFYVIGALVLVWLATGLFQVGSAERGVIQRFGKYSQTRSAGLGWHLPWPIETVRKVNVASINSVDYKSRMLTADVNLVDIHVAVQFRYSDPLAVLFKVRDPENTLREISESAIREIVGQSRLDDVLVGSRQQITERTRELIQRTLESYESGIVVSTVNLVDVQVPDAVAASQRDANKAIEDRDRFSKEAQAYANDILPKAQGTAQRTVQDAQAYKSKVVAQAEGEASRFSQLAAAYALAPDVTRQRLYIETMETVLSRSRKVLLDAKGSGGNMIYLPLDKMLERSGTVRATVEPPGSGATRLPDMDADSVDGRSRGDR